MVTRPKDIELQYYQDHFILLCGGKTDPSTSLSVRWFQDGYQLHNGQNSVIINHVNVTNNSRLTIITGNDTDKKKSHAGMYICELDNGFSSVSEFGMVWYVPGNETMNSMVQQGEQSFLHSHMRFTLRTNICIVRYLLILFR